MKSDNRFPIVERGANCFIDWSQFRENPHRFSKVAKPTPPPRPITKPDTNNATYIDYQSITADPKKREKYELLDGYNSGRKSLIWDNESYQIYKMNSDLLNAVASQLELSRLQRSEALRRFLSLNLGKWGQRVDLIAFCVCAVTVHQDGTDRTYHPNQLQENRDSVFDEVASSLGLSDQAIRREYGKVESFFRNQNAGDPDRYLQFEQQYDRGENGTRRGI